MRADIHDGQERERSTQGPDTEAQDQQSSDRHFWLATHGRSIQMCQSRAFAGYATPLKSLPLISPRQYWPSASALRLLAAQVTHVECFHRSAEAFKGEFACKFYVH